MDISGCTEAQTESTKRGTPWSSESHRSWPCAPPPNRGGPICVNRGGPIFLPVLKTWRRSECKQPEIFSMFYKIRPHFHILLETPPRDSPRSRCAIQIISNPPPPPSIPGHDEHRPQPATPPLPLALYLFYALPKLFAPHSSIAGSVNCILATWL